MTKEVKVIVKHVLRRELYAVQVLMYRVRGSKGDNAQPIDEVGVAPEVLRQIRESVISHLDLYGVPELRVIPVTMLGNPLGTVEEARIVIGLSPYDEVRFMDTWITIMNREPGDLVVLIIPSSFQMAEQGDDPEMMELRELLGLGPKQPPEVLRLDGRTIQHIAHVTVDLLLERTKRELTIWVNRFITIGIVVGLGWILFANPNLILPVVTIFVLEGMLGFFFPLSDEGVDRAFAQHGIMLVLTVMLAVGTVVRELWDEEIHPSIEPIMQEFCELRDAVIIVLLLCLYFIAQYVWSFAFPKGEQYMQKSADEADEFGVNLDGGFHGTLARRSFGEWLAKYWLGRQAIRVYRFVRPVMIVILGVIIITGVFLLVIAAGIWFGLEYLIQFVWSFFFPRDKVFVDRMHEIEDPATLEEDKEFSENIAFLQGTELRLRFAKWYQSDRSYGWGIVLIDAFLYVCIAAFLVARFRLKADLWVRGFILATAWFVIRWVWGGFTSQFRDSHQG